jgi:hypothetical protein
VTFELELLEKDFNERRVSDFICIVNPIIKLCKSIRSRSREALRIKRQLKRQIKNPILLSTASSDEVNSLAGLQDFYSELIAQKRWDHHIVERILLRP